MSIHHSLHNQQTFIGIDVAKARLDLCLINEAGNTPPLHRQFENTTQGWREIVALLDQHHIICITLEATGGYEQGVARFLQAVDLPVAVVNPFVARRFAQGLGLLAKTDKIDAWMLAVYAQKASPRLKSHQLHKNERLAELNWRR